MKVMAHCSRDTISVTNQTSPMLLSLLPLLLLRLLINFAEINERMNAIWGFFFFFYNVREIFYIKPLIRPWANSYFKHTAFFTCCLSERAVIGGVFRVVVRTLRLPPSLPRCSSWSSAFDLITRIQPVWLKGWKRCFVKKASPLHGRILRSV